MLKEYLRKEKKLIIGNIGVKLTGSLLEISLPALLAFIIDSIIPGKNFKSLMAWGGLMALVALMAWFLNIRANRMSARVSTSVIFRLRQDLFEKSMNLSSRRISDLTLSSLESRMTSDTYTVHRLISVGLTMGVRILVMFFGGILFCLILSPRLSLVLLALILPILLFVRLIFSRTMPLFKKAQERLDNMVQVIRESVRGVRVIKAYDKTDYEKNRYKEVDDFYRETEIKAQGMMAMTRPMVEAILFTGLALVIILGGFLVARGQVKVGVIIAFLSYFIQITMALVGFNIIFNIFNRAMTSMKRIERVMDSPKDKNQIERDEPVALPERNPSVAEIEFKDVSFSYLGEEKDLDHISFKIYPGQSLGIMGPTGSGKSTIIRLLLRQYDPDEGTILVRGVDIKDLSIKDLRSIVSVAHQSDFLYSSSLRDNISFGRGLGDEAIREAVKDAQADDFISSKEKGLDFKLASKGVNLSGGQKQRVILSRALAGDPEILILDDSTSALDFKTEARFRGILEKKYKKTSKIIVGQRVSSMEGMDKILFLKGGRALGFGSHQELMEELDLYKDLARMQGGY